MNSNSSGTIQPSGDIDGLRACLNDLIGVLALPAIWTGQEQDLVIKTLLDAVGRILELDVVYARLNFPEDKPIEMIRIAGADGDITNGKDSIRRVLKQWLSGNPEVRSSVLTGLHQVGKLRLAAFSLGSDEQTGVFVAGSDRIGFPTSSERLLLSVAAGQAAIGLREAQMRNEQRSIAQELRVEAVQQKQELALAKDRLKKENEQRKAAERAMRSLEERLLCEALGTVASTQAEKSQLAELRENYARLTPREREVLPFVVAGRLSKQIAAELGTSEITIRVHRGQIMRKMRAQSLAELIRMADALRIGLPGPPSFGPHMSARHSASS